MAQRLLQIFEYFFYEQSLTQLQSVEFAPVIECCVKVFVELIRKKYGCVHAAKTPFGLNDDSSSCTLISGRDGNCLILRTFRHPRTCNICHKTFRKLVGSLCGMRIWIFIVNLLTCLWCEPPVDVIHFIPF